MIRPFCVDIAGWCLLLVLLATPLMADDSLYAGQGPLDPGTPDTDAALLQALDEVLVRLTGEVDAPLREQLGLDLREARSLVQSQQRVRVPLVDEQGEIDLALRLQVEFNASALDERLADAALPRLGRERPDLLLWIAIEDDQGVRLSDLELLNTVFSEQARRLGLDVLQPLGDAFDLAEVSANDVRGGFLGAGDSALQRYQADIPLMLDLRQIQPGVWAARWFWRIDGRDRSLNLRADSPAALVSDGMEAVLGSLADRYAVTPDSLGPRRQLVVVAPINDESQYAEVLSHLEELSMVDSVRVLAARERSIDFELILRSGGLDDALSLGGLLEVQSTLQDGRLALTFTQ